MIPNLLPRIVLTAALGGLAAWLSQERGFRIPSVAHTLVGVALGLLLVFRTNTAYDRYWEGRRLIGGLVNRCRDLLRQVAAYIAGDDEASAVERAALVRHIDVMFALVRQHLRRERDLSALGDLVAPSERIALEPAAVDRRRP